ncbi:MULTISPECIES: rhomboid family intramembrane serine protease [unclassified Treponema]|uniref:rhomboid family intramembrane serine protease n=1 Tax=unclassified Treponema TaxID=2638727 RepID=UPI0020A4FE1E|nr:MULTISPECIES: rhomboid family intramembrane serine protease [unclassified Treponema]UTC66893.1 rhomboid family intramembrane serine protease [Treponema sp. OMZ 789]UTC69622.1 rhomboid family intramembrane serine protease [Treponema sp. OMZ 790]UTC72336.1 rhomboid family intramembrane serine protease [Treponema sp. OMZ 791]
MKYLRKPFKYTYKNAVLVIALINAVVFVLTSLFRNLSAYLGLVPILVVYAQTYWQIFTYQFVHGDFFHLAFNMLTLFFFGVPVEKKIGTKEFVLYYLLIGTIDGALSFLVYAATGFYNITLVGASGAIFGVLLLYAVIYPNSIIYLWAVVPVPAPLLILGYAVIELISIFSVGDGVAHLTHFIGLLTGWAYIRIRFGIKPLKVWNSTGR